MRNTLIAACILLCAPAAAELPKKEFDSLKKKAQKALKLGDMTTTASAVQELAADDSKRAVQFFLSLAKVPDQSVYDALRGGLSGMTSDAAQEQMLDTVSKRGSSMSKLLLVDAMEKRTDDFSVKLLSAALTSKKPEIQRAAIMVIKTNKAREACGALIELLTELLKKKGGDALNANLARQTLTALTGESFRTAEDWSNYWASNSDGAAAPRPDAGQGAGGADEKVTKRRKTPTFFGSEILSKRVVFVIDTSLSMDEGAMQRQNRTVYPEGSGPARQAAAPTTRIERAKEQLRKVIGQLPRDAKFGIVAYSAPKPGPTKLVPGQPIPPEINKFRWLNAWRPKLLPANKKSKGSAAQWVSALYADGLTYTLRALEAALQMPDVDMIVLLSDGEPNDIDLQTGQKLTLQQILAEVSKLNRAKRCVINTFGILTDPAPGMKRPGHLEAFLQDMAKQNGGTYTKVKQ